MERKLDFGKRGGNSDDVTRLLILRDAEGSYNLLKI